MAKYDRLVALLPSLYRPESEDDTLLNRLLQSTGAVLDQAGVQANHVMFAHWFDVADKATWDAHYQTERQARGLPPANVRNVRDQREILNYPYISDLARLCALLGISPWREPAVLRESVEAYRQRVCDLMDAYRLGLTTVPALRRLIEAELPEDMSGDLAQQRWPFAIEEPVSLGTHVLSVKVPESPLDAISPLWRWNAPPETDAMAVPTVYLQGVEPGTALALTERPGIEYVTPFATPFSVSLTYTGTLSPYQTLRLQPATCSWLVHAGGLLRSTVPTAANLVQDPSVNGPWSPIPGAPGGHVMALTGAIDHTLWLIVRSGDNDALYRFDGSTFRQIAQGSPVARFQCVRGHGPRVFVGTSKGLFRIELFPDNGQFQWVAVAAATSAIHQLTVITDDIAAASDSGLIRLDANLTRHQVWLEGVPVYAALQREQDLLMGVDAGLVRWRDGAWALYEGRMTSEDAPDWRALPETDIATAEGGMSVVTQLAAMPDGSLWLGSATGLARYYARPQENGSAYQTVLEAFPDLCSAVSQLVVDERGMVWAATAQGILRFDGRDIARLDPEKAAWHWLGQADTVYPDAVTAEVRGHWRYSRSEQRWERFHPRQKRFTGDALPLRTSDGKPAHAVLWTQSVIADLGQFDGKQFTAVSPVSHAALRVRVKPDQTRVLPGGLPALPRPQDATSGWRYIQVPAAEPTPPEHRPWWSTEGQLFPEPHAKMPWPGHFRHESSVFQQDAHSFDPNTLNETDNFDPVLSNEAAIFIYPPSARVWMAWPRLPRMGVQVRLFKRDGQPIDPAITDRVWASMQRARAASVPVALRVEDTLVHSTELPAVYS